MLEAPVSTAPHLLGSFQLRVQLCRSYRGKRDDIHSATPRSTDRWATVSLSGASMTLMKSYGLSTANELVVRPSGARVPGVAIVGVK